VCVIKVKGATEPLSQHPKHMPMTNSTPPSNTSSTQRIVEMKRKALHASGDALFLVRLFARMCQQGQLRGTELHATAMHAF